MDDHRTASNVDRLGARIHSVRAGGLRDIDRVGDCCVRDRFPRVRRHNSSWEVEVHAGVAQAARLRMDVDATRVRHAAVRAARARQVDASQHVCERLRRRLRRSNRRHRVDDASHHEGTCVVEVLDKGRRRQRHVHAVGQYSARDAPADVVVDDHRAALYVVGRAARLDGVRALSCAASRRVRDRCPRVRRHSACEVVPAGVARAARSHVDVDAARVHRAEVRAAIARRVDASQNVLECLVCAHCRHRTDRANHRECAGVAQVRHEARSCQRLSQRRCRRQRQEDDLHHGKAHHGIRAGGGGPPCISPRIVLKYNAITHFEAILSAFFMTDEIRKISFRKSIKTCVHR